MEINVNIQTTTENHQSTNDNHNYDNRRSYNNLHLIPGECLVPIRVDWEMVNTSICARTILRPGISDLTRFW